LVDTFLKLEIDANQFKAKKEAAEADEEPAPTKGLKYATFGNGCFWCTEAVFEELHGVKRVVSGYSGGHVANPTYEQVCSKRTGHAEVIHLSYDPKQTSYAKLLEVFWRTHDPTTLNRQGNDKGPQYRSVVFYHDEEQKELATHYKKKLNQAKAFGRPVVTEITEFEKFYPAEGYHQNYYKLNPNYGYCRMLIKPKLKKFRRVFADELAKNPKNRAPKSAKK
jgi:peptide-methionine (S)-S-oxide reductase